jgi:hypothetical protein
VLEGDLTICTAIVERFSPEVSKIRRESQSDFPRQDVRAAKHRAENNGPHSLAFVTAERDGYGAGEIVVFRSMLSRTWGRYNQEPPNRYVVTEPMSTVAAAAAHGIPDERARF